MEGRDLGGRRLGGFLLGEVLGRGGFATVYRAHQLRLDRDVAVKVLDAELARNPDAARRFEREGRAAAALDHPNIVPVYEAGDEDSLVYLAMRLVPGRTLADALAETSPLPVDDLLRIVEPLAQAIDHAHAHDLVHRDVKPGNVLLEPRPGGTEWVWLTDFGIAATTRDVGRYTSGTLGTAWYMAPEQAEGGEVDGRADLYSLGCIVFECLTGHPPYPRDDLIAALMAHVQAPIPSTGDGRLDEFFTRALAKAPGDRFASAAELVAALRSTVADGGILNTLPDATHTQRGMPPTVPPASELSATPRPEARPRSRVASLVAIATLFVVLAGAAAVLASRGDDEPRDEQAGSTTSSSPTTAAVVAGAPQVVAGGDLSLALDTTIDDLNPHRDIDAEAMITGLVLPPMYRLDENLQWQPYVAAGPPQYENDEPLTVRYELRDDAIWSDGTPITTADVQATYDYVNDPASGAQSLNVFERMESLEVIDEHSFRVVFAQPLGRVEALFSTFHPLIQAAALEQHRREGKPIIDFLRGDIPFSGGPYEEIDFIPGSRLQLEASDGWWGEPPLLDEVDMRFFASNDEAVAALADGAADAVFVRYPDSAQASEAAASDGVELLHGPSDLRIELTFNLTAGPSADPLVREAVAHALDRQAIVDAQVSAVTGRPGEPVQSLIYLPDQPEATSPFDPYTGDESAAEAALTEAGWVPAADGGPRTKDGQQLILRLLYPDDGPAALATVSLWGALAGQLEDVGIGVQGNPRSATEYSAALEAGDWDMALEVSSVAPDPSKNVLVYTSDGIGNVSGYANPAVDEQLAVTERLAHNQEERARTFNAVDQQLAVDLPSMPIYQLPAFLAHDCQLGGMVFGLERGGPLRSLAQWGWYESPPEGCTPEP